MAYMKAAVEDNKHIIALDKKHRKITHPSKKEDFDKVFRNFEISTNQLQKPKIDKN